MNSQFNLPFTKWTSRANLRLSEWDPTEKHKVLCMLLFSLKDWFITHPHIPKNKNDIVSYPCHCFQSRKSPIWITLGRAYSILFLDDAKRGQAGRNRAFVGYLIPPSSPHLLAFLYFFFFFSIYHTQVDCMEFLWFLGDGKVSISRLNSNMFVCYLVCLLISCMIRCIKVEGLRFDMIWFDCCRTTCVVIMFCLREAELRVCGFC